MNDAAKQRDTKSTSLIGKRRTRFLYICIISLTVIVLAFVYFFIPGMLGDKESVSPKIRQMRKLAEKVGRLEIDMKNKEYEFSNLLKKYYERTGENLPALSALGLSEEQQKVLEDKIKNQQDVSIKGLINDILDKNAEISRIKETIKRYEALLPRPHIVIEGETHYQIAMDFLVHDREVPNENALWLVERTAIFEELKPKFKVWNFYSGDEYGTFVTQGDADISPNELNRQAKKKLTSARDQAVAEIKTLESKKSKLNSQVKELQGENEELRKQNKKLSEENYKMQKRLKTLNTLSIILDLEKNLIKSDILKSVFLGSPKLKDIPARYFNYKIDLREKNTIEISARKFKLPKIKKITLYPKKYYKENTDYKVEIDANGKKAVLTILEAKNFKNNRIVISVE